MTDDKAELRAALRLAMTTIRKMKAHQPVKTTEVLPSPEARCKRRRSKEESGLLDLIWL
jgi:hypothetical protein